MTGSSPLSFRLPRARRIKQGRDFAQIKMEGRRVASGSLVANWRSLPQGTPSRIGIVTSRRVGRAVQRNLVRRILREIFRLHQHAMAQPLDLVLVARPSITGKSYRQIEADLLHILSRARLLRPTP